MGNIETDRRTDFAQAFTRAIADRGVSLSWLHRRLQERANPVSIGTLSYWRSGDRHPEGTRSVAALADIEHLLGLDPGELLTLVTARVRLGALRDPYLPFSDEQLVAATSETLEQLDAPPLDITRELSTHVTTEVNEDGLISGRTTQLLIQAVSETVDEVTYTLVSPDASILVPRIDVRGGRLVRDLLHETARVYAYVVRLDDPLPLGATGMIEVSLSARGELPSARETGAFVVRPVRNLVVWTRFPPDAVPEWVDEIEETSETDGMVTRFLEPRAHVHQQRRDFGPGALGIRWGYDDA